MASKDVWVSWYTCDCDYISKYCDDYHRACALVPVSALEPYYAEVYVTVERIHHEDGTPYYGRGQEPDLDEIAKSIRDAVSDQEAYGWYKYGEAVKNEQSDEG